MQAQQIFQQAFRIAKQFGIANGHQSCSKGGDPEWYGLQGIPPDPFRAYQIEDRLPRTPDCCPPDFIHAGLQSTGDMLNSLSAGKVKRNLIPF